MSSDNLNTIIIGMKNKNANIDLQAISTNGFPIIGRELIIKYIANKINIVYIVFILNGCKFIFIIIIINLTELKININGL